MEGTDLELEEVKAEKRRGWHLRSLLGEIFETALFALLIFLALRAVVQNFKVEGSSMEPSLRSGQYLLVDKLEFLHIDLDTIGRVVPGLNLEGRGPLYLFHPPQRGDVVVFRFPKDPRRDFIKRVVATPGETVEIRGGRILVNGKELEEPYIRSRPNYERAPEQVPPDNYFVLGDNRNNSSDSHVWGMVPWENIVGKAWLIYWPLGELGLAPNYSLSGPD